MGAGALNLLLDTPVLLWWLTDDLKLSRTARDALMNEEGFQHLPITYQHALYAGALESNHRDPFDRMLASQAALGGYTLVTPDAAFQAFAIQRPW